MKSRKSKARYIHYSEDNDEPEDHRAGKERIRTFLQFCGFILISNTDKFEYKLPELYNDIGDQKRNYQLDVLMYNPKDKLMLIAEVHGAYHFTSDKRIADIKLKTEIVSSYFRRNGILEVRDKRYDYDNFKYFNIKTEDLKLMNSQELRHKLLY